MSNDVMYKAIDTFHHNRHWEIFAAIFPESERGALQDGENLNNYVEVLGDTSDQGRNETRSRLLSDSGTLTSEERAMIQQSLSG